MKLYFGIDLGGSKIELAVINENFDTIHKERLLTEVDLGFYHVLNQINLLYLNALKKINHNDHSIGLGTPGSISSDKKIINSTIPFHNGINLKEVLENKLQHEVILENDANCFVLAESLLGSGKKYSSVFGIILGTGCGGGLFINNKLWPGANNLAGEWGHSIIDINGRECFCGKRGCINAYISGTALERQINIKLNKRITAKDFLNKKKYTKQEKDIIDEYLLFYIRSLVNIILTLDPEAIIIGGGLSNFPNLYNKLIKNELKKIIGDKIKTKILQNKLGDSSGVIGAALLGVK